MCCIPSMGSNLWEDLSGFKNLLKSGKWPRDLKLKQREVVEGTDNPTTLKLACQG